MLLLFGGGFLSSENDEPDPKTTQPGKTTDFITRIDGAISQTFLDIGIPKKSIYRKQKDAIEQLPESKITDITIKINKRFPAALVNHAFQQAVIDSGGRIIDAYEKKSATEIYLHLGYGEILTHRLRIKRISGAPVDSAYVALVIDDFGDYTVPIAKKFFELNISFSASILPNGKYTSDVLNELDKHNRIERLVHIPMEPKAYPRIDPGADAILVSLDDRDILKLVEKMLADIPGAVGANNHMGSKATENSRVMFQVLRVLRDAGFFWVDSRTTPYSVAEDIAKEKGVPATHIDHIIDPPGITEDEIEKRLFDYCFKARRMPAMIINCHCSDTTAKILKRDIPPLIQYGIKFITVSQAMEKKEKWKQGGT